MTFIMMAMNYKMTAMMTNVYNHHEGWRLWHLKDDGQFDNLMTMTEGDYSVDNYDF